MVLSKSGPFPFPSAVEKSRPVQIPNASVAAAYATPRGAAAIGVIFGVNRQALKSGTMAYS
jgi:hypothetical protein